MILSEFMEGNRSANVCKQQNEWVTMLYENDEYLRAVICRNEDEAECVAEEWVHREPI
jgi:hypothetical protein